MTIPDHYVELSKYLGHHLEAEAAALAAYERFVEGREDVVGYLVRLVLADEHRHHELFAEMRNALESSIAWRQIEPRVPSARIDAHDAAELLETTEALLDLERADAAELARLRRRWSRQGEERRLWALLVETAELDTRKHIRILEYLRERLREQR